MKTLRKTIKVELEIEFEYNADRTSEDMAVLYAKDLAFDGVSASILEGVKLLKVSEKNNDRYYLLPKR